VNITSITANIKKSCDDLGQIDLSGIKLEEAGAQLLNVSEMDFDQHVAIQPSAITFFGVLRKEVNRRVDAYKKSYDRWQKKMYAQAKVAVMSGTQDYKPTVADIEARFIVDNEKEIEKHEKQLEKLKDEADTIDAWYEGWRQKSFTIREWAGIENDERYQGGGSIVEKEDATPGGNGQRANRGGGAKELRPDSIKRVREMMRKRKATAEKKKLATRAK
jgi:hypothetical protein